MIASLPLFHRIAGRPVIVLGEGDAAAAKRRMGRHVGAYAEALGSVEAERLAGTEPVKN